MGMLIQWLWPTSKVTGGNLQLWISFCGCELADCTIHSGSPTVVSFCHFYIRNVVFKFWNHEAKSSSSNLASTGWVIKKICTESSGNTTFYLISRIHNVCLQNMYSFCQLLGCRDVPKACRSVTSKPAM